MKLRTEWIQYLHDLRRREVEIIFSKCPKRLFQTGLELGGGDGFQSSLLGQYVLKLTSTDYGPDILKNKSNEYITYRICDAEELVNEFSSDQFDFVFSSNLLEHLPNPQKALRGIFRVLKDDGITIHVIPSPFWKLCHLVLHIPNISLGTLETLTERGGFYPLLKKIRKCNKDLEYYGNAQKLGNNPKTQRTPKSFVHRLFVPQPHGVSPNNIRELYAFSKSRWKKEFEAANLDLLRIIEGPVTSGYGFGLNAIRNVLEGFGFTSEYIYIAAKKGSDSLYKRYF